MGEKISDKVSTSSMYTSPMEGLGNVFGGTSSNQPAYDFMLDKLGMTPDVFDALGGSEQAGVLSSIRELGFEGDTSMGGDWFGVEGLDMGAVVGGAQAVSGGLDMYSKIKGIGQQQDIFDRQKQLLDQKIAMNKYIRESDIASKKAFSGATKSAFKKEEPITGLGTVG